MATERRSIGKSLIAGCVLFVLLYGLLLGAIGYNSYRNGLYQSFNMYLDNLLRLTLTQIDGDDLATCIQTLEHSPAYDQLQTFLDNVRESHDVDFIYVVLPLRAEGEDNLMDVIAGTSEHERMYESDELTHLGHYTEDFYPPNIAQHYLDCFRANQNKTDYFRNDTELFGREYTAVRPIQDSQGNAVAVLAADMSAQGIANRLMNYLIFHVIVTTVLTILFGWGMYLWLKRRVVEPLGRISDSVTSFVRNSHNVQDTGSLLLDDPQVHTNDEFEDLANSVITLSSDIKTYLHDMLSAAATAEEMRGRAQEMGKLALVDALTGVRNRVSYAAAEAQLDERIEQGNAHFGIAMCDLNNLKGINDSYGHECGDSYIRASCKLICEVFRHSPVYRVGGDEFVAVLEGHDLEHGDELLGALHAAVAVAARDEALKPWERPSVACGVAIYDPAQDVSTASVFHRADQAMYLDKRAYKLIQEALPTTGAQSSAAPADPGSDA